MAAQEYKGVPVTWVYSDVTGETHFKDIVVDLSRLNGHRGAKHKEPEISAWSDLVDAPIGVQFRRVDKRGDHDNKAKGWTKPSEPAMPGNYVIFLTGRYEIITTDGKRREFGPGDILLEDNFWGKGHIGRGLTPERTQLFVYLKSSPGQNPQPVPSK